MNKNPASNRKAAARAANKAAAGSRNPASKVVSRAQDRAASSKVAAASRNLANRASSPGKGGQQGGQQKPGQR
ncbi:MAG TPA: hypothetical protein VKF40_00395 [Burkholderiales bacterium]|nr:hypothetical protein [Burkholderiales bacterium]